MRSTKNYTSHLLRFVVVIAVLFSLSCKKDKELKAEAEPFKIESYYPNSGNEGTLVTILGTGFDTEKGNVLVSFAGQPADIISLQQDKVIVRAPKGGKSGSILLKSGSNQSEVGSYKYQALSLKEIFPANGAAGSHIKIIGEGFSSITNPAEVFVNGKAAIVVSVSDTELVVEIPEDAGNGPVQVKVNGFESTGPVFHYQAIQSIKPITGGKGTRVTIKGTGFDPEIAGNEVDFNGKFATVVSAKDDELVVVAPTGVETGPLSITINKQRITGPDFTVVPPPTIQMVSPLSGPGGLEMVITGLTFSANKEENKVFINGVNVPLTAATATELKLTIPGNTGTGLVKVVVNDQDVNGPKFSDQTLGIKDLTPDNGLSGTEVTLTGTGFSSIPTENIVSFNNIPTTVLSSSATKITVKAPANLTTGTLKVKVGSLEADAPRPFKRAGVMTLIGGLGTSEIEVGTKGSIAVDASGNVYAIENLKNRIIKVTPNGQFTVFAGSPGGSPGLQNGQGTQALFNFNRTGSIAIDKNQNVYVADFWNQLIRKITPQGMVSTFASNVGYVYNLTTDPEGNIYAIRGRENILKLSPNGALSSLGITSDNYYHRPAFDKYGNFYINPDAFQIYITKHPFRPAGSVPLPAVTYWVGSMGEPEYRDGIGEAAKFMNVKSIQAYEENLYVLDSGSPFEFLIRQVSLQTRTVSTVLRGSRGSKDGSLSEASFLSATDITIDKDGVIYILDEGNNSIRKVYLR